MEAVNISELVRGIYYIGVNDRTTTRFEGLWPLPAGVSYNSYLVNDEKVAVIDTVEVSSAMDYLTQIREIIGDKDVDYLVVNHMEPDHSGTIPFLLERYPSVKIVGNRQTISMIGGFYKITDSDRFLEIKDGDELSLGKKTLKFYLTPMVHWPETMMTYCKEDNLLFSGDAFGTFGALNGAVLDSAMGTDLHVKEMYRYYADIVGKYGAAVVRALSKLKDVEIKYICSTHGPVWHDRVSEVVGIVSRLANYEPEPGAVIVYGSMYGNTESAAEAVARELSKRGVKKIIMYNASYSDLSYMISDALRYEILVVGSPTYSMHLFPPVEQFMIAMETREIKNRVFATFGSHTWASAAVRKLDEYASRLKWEVASSFDFKQSMTEDTRKQAAQLAEEVVRLSKTLDKC